MDTPNFKSDIVQAHEHQIQLINDFYSGVDTARNHLIKYTKESDANFKIRKELARLSNYTRESVETIGSFIFRKNLNVTAFEKNSLFDYFDKIDLVNSIDAFAKDTLKNLTKDGITYIMVEKLPYDEIKTKADELKIRPYFVNIKRADVLNFKTDNSGNFLQFTYNELYSIKEGYKTTEHTQQRCYRFDDDGACIVEIWRDDELLSVEPVELGFIPIVQIGNDLVPYIYDLAIQNKNHFNLKNEQRYYARMCAYPQRVTYLLDTQSGSIELGANEALNFDAPKSEAGFEVVELNGKSVEVLEGLIVRDEEDMRKYIIGMVENDIQKTAKEVSVTNAGNEATLQEYATMLENGLNDALYIMGVYQGLTITERVLVNREYSSEILTSEQIRELKDLYVNGVISWDKLVQALIKGEVLEFEDESEIEVMKNQIVLGS